MFQFFNVLNVNGNGNLNFKELEYIIHPEKEEYDQEKNKHNV